MRNRAAVLVVLALLTVPQIVAQKESPKISTSDGKALLRECSLTLDVNVYHPREVKNKFEAFDLGYCLGLVQGVYANTSGTTFCSTRDIQVREVLELTVKFLKAHPELQGKDSADIVRWALSDEFPCLEKGRSKDDPQTEAQH